jgi:hypothetical protein
MHSPVEPPAADARGCCIGKRTFRLRVVLAETSPFSVQLELVNLLKNGDLARLWAVASQTDLTFNLVSTMSRLAAFISLSHTA